MNKKGKSITVQKDKMWWPLVYLLWQRDNEVKETSFSLKSNINDKFLAGPRALTMTGKLRES